MCHYGNAKNVFDVSSFRALEIACESEGTNSSLSFSEWEELCSLSVEHSKGLK